MKACSELGGQHKNDLLVTRGVKFIANKIYIIYRMLIVVFRLVEQCARHCCSSSDKLLYWECGPTHSH